MQCASEPVIFMLLKKNPLKGSKASFKLFRGCCINNMTESPEKIRSKASEPVIFMLPILK